MMKIKKKLKIENRMRLKKFDILKFDFICFLLLFHEMMIKKTNF